jgi:hypothetical protein
MGTNTTDHGRRAILGALAIGLPVAVAGAYAGTAGTTPVSVGVDTAAWDKAFAALRAAEAASTAYDNNEYESRRERWLAAGRPDTGALRERLRATVDRSNALGEALADRQTDLMLLPAPHGEALMWKLNHVLEDSGDGGCAPWSISYLEQMMADARRLLTGAEG